MVAVEAGIGAMMRVVDVEDECSCCHCLSQELERRQQGLVETPSEGAPVD